jgi:hypothetical protein
MNISYGVLYHTSRYSTTQQHGRSLRSLPMSPLFGCLFGQYNLNLWPNMVELWKPVPAQILVLVRVA